MARNDDQSLDSINAQFTMQIRVNNALNTANPQHQCPQQHVIEHDFYSISTKQLPLSWTLAGTDRSNISRQWRNRSLSSTSPLPIITLVLVWLAAAIKLHVHTRRADDRVSQRTAVWHAVSM